jgi:hypothetical protein
MRLPILLAVVAIAAPARAEDRAVRWEITGGASVLGPSPSSFTSSAAAGLFLEGTLHVRRFGLAASYRRLGGEGVVHRFALVARCDLVGNRDAVIVPFAQAGAAIDVYDADPSGESVHRDAELAVGIRTRLPARHGERVFGPTLRVGVVWFQPPGGADVLRGAAFMATMGLSYGS